MSDETLMARAIDEAKRGRPSPNPHVGAVVANADGTILGCGHHERAGEAHAEVAAIADATETRGHTLFVTMEPCNHHGRTPPCTEAVIAAGFARVVVGARDPAPHVPGSVEKMRAAGIEVTLGVLEQECEWLIADFSKHIQTGLPFVTLKAAVTLDGRMATRTGDSKWITGEEARTEAHRMRDRSDAVLVGIGTVLADDPALTVRHVDGVDPVRVVLDAGLRTPPNATLAAAGTLVMHASDAPRANAESLRAKGCELIEVPRVEGRLDVGAVLAVLGKRDIVRVLVEGGPTLHASFLAGGHADYAAIFVAPKVVGDREAPAFAGGRGVDSIANAWTLKNPRVQRFGVDVLIEGQLVS